MSVCVIFLEDWQDHGGYPLIDQSMQISLKYLLPEVMTDNEVVDISISTGCEVS